VNEYATPIILGSRKKIMYKASGSIRNHCG